MNAMYEPRVCGAAHRGPHDGVVTRDRHTCVRGEQRARLAREVVTERISKRQVVGQTWVRSGERLFEIEAIRERIGHVGGLGYFVRCAV